MKIQKFQMLRANNLLSVRYNSCGNMQSEVKWETQYALWRQKRGEHRRLQSKRIFRNMKENQFNKSTQILSQQNHTSRKCGNKSRNLFHQNNKIQFKLNGTVKKQQITLTDKISQPCSHYLEKISDDKIQQCQIRLIYEGNKLHISHRVTTIGDLNRFLHNRIKKNKSKHIIGFKTTCRDIKLDYYLTIDSADGHFLNKQVVELEPIFRQQQSQINLNSFQVLQCIGSGGFSYVFLCRFLQDGRFYAMKVLNKKWIVQNKKKNIVMNERNVMKQLNNQFVMKMYFCFESYYYPGGQLFSLVKKYHRMSQEMARFYMVEILLGLKHIHQNGIVYRDFKPQNIIINRQGHLCIADFGLAKPNIFELRDQAYSFCGSPEYMAPEMIRKNGHSLPVDFYCLGALLFQLITGLPPFYNQNPEEIYKATLNKPIQFPSNLNLSEQITSLLKGLLCKDEEKRIGSLFGVNEVLGHPWFKDINCNHYLQKKIVPPKSFSNIKDLCFNSADITSEQQKSIKNIHYEQSIDQNQRYIKVMNGFYYDIRTQNQVSCCHQINTPNISSSGGRKEFILNTDQSQSSLRHENKIQMEIRKSSYNFNKLRLNRNSPMSVERVFQTINNYI